MNLDATITPKHQTDLQIAEFSIDEILNRLDNSVHTFNTQGKSYEVYLGANRYKIFKRSRVCACCGIIGNRMFLDYDEQTTQEIGKPAFHFNLYAENYDKIQGNHHLVLMIKSCIISRSKGGDDADLDNLRTMCFNCSNLKELTDDLPLEKLQNILFPAYRAYRSTAVLNKAKEYTLKFRDKIEKNENGIEKIKEAFKLVKPEKIPELEAKIEILTTQASQLREMCDKFELEAQTTGLVPPLLG